MPGFAELLCSQTITTEYPMIATPASIANSISRIHVRNHSPLFLKSVQIADGGPLGSSYTRWRLWQHDGNDEPMPHEFYRWKMWCDEFPQLRHQGIQDHILSFSALVDEKSSLLVRRGVKLNQLLLLRCAQNHDLPEPHLKRDVMATKKTGADDLMEYLKFAELMRDCDPARWTELDEVYLLQLAGKNPECFPPEARATMSVLKEKYPNETWLFPGLEMLDYLYSAYEGTYERGVEVMLPSVASRQIPGMDKIAEGFPPFGEYIWTPELREFFAEAAASHQGDNGAPPAMQMRFEW